MCDFVGVGFRISARVLTVIIFDFASIIILHSSQRTQGTNKEAKYFYTPRPYIDPKTETRLSKM